MGKKETFIYRDMTGGVNFRSNELNINQGMEKTEMALITNMEIYRGGGFQAQKGNTQLNTGVTDKTQVLGIGEYITANTTYAIYFKASGKAYVMDSAGGAETEIKSGLDTSAIPSFTSSNGSCLCMNGVDNAFVATGTTNPAPDVTTPPADWTSTKPHVACNLLNERVLAAAGSTLYWNKQGDLNTWTTASDAGQVTDIYQDPKKINALAPFGNVDIVHSGSRRIYQFTGTTYSTYGAAPIPSNRSAIGKNAVAYSAGYQFFFSGDMILPVYATPFGQVQINSQMELSYKINPFFSGTEDDLIINPIDRTKSANAILLPYDLKNQLIGYFQTQSSGVTGFDTAAIYDFNYGAWYFRQTTPITAAAMVNGKVLTGTSDGAILQEFSGSTIYGTNPFQKRIVTPFFDFLAPHLKKRIVNMGLWIKCMTDVTLTINFYGGYNNDILHSVTRTYSDSGDAASYGNGEYGTNSYGSIQVVDDYWKNNMQDKVFRMEILSTDASQDYRIIGMWCEVEYLDTY